MTGSLELLTAFIPGIAFLLAFDLVYPKRFSGLNNIEIVVLSGGIWYALLLVILRQTELSTYLSIESVEFGSTITRHPELILYSLVVMLGAGLFVGWVGEIVLRKMISEQKTPAQYAHLLSELEEGYDDYVVLEMVSGDRYYGFPVYYSDYRDDDFYLVLSEPQHSPTLDGEFDPMGANNVAFINREQIRSIWFRSEDVT